MKIVDLGKVIRILSILSAIALYTSDAYSQDGLLLDCSLEGGYSDIQIYINQVEGYVLYNAHLRDSYERQRAYKHEAGGSVVIDEALDITTNNDSFILADNNNSSFVLVKDTATYAYAWTTPIPVNAGKFLAFGNHHTGKCLTNPFFRTD